MGVVFLVGIEADLWLAWQYVVFLRAARGSHSSLLTPPLLNSDITAAAKAKKRLQVCFSYFHFIHYLSDSNLDLHVSHVTVYQSMMQLATVTVFIFSS